ncbi:MAG: hypothetical protein MUE30_13600 [Spirosomaceae bacterium]|jgi:hypothetical protein|nr:hypothetical protein [Spirosomataceae bacterium]
MKTVHFISGIILAAFVALHLINHLAVLASPEAHIALMNSLRVVYRNLVVEAILLVAVLIQIITGVGLVRSKGFKQASWEKWQVGSGLYLAFFFVMHVSAVMVGRFVLKLDTNLYFGAAGLNAFPANLFFVPYYGLAVLSLFTHIASIHAQKSKHAAAHQQAQIIVGLGLLTAALILVGMTHFFGGLAIPKTYQF